MLAGDLLLVRADQRPAADDLGASHEQAVDAVRAAQNEVRDEIVGAAELEAVGPPDREVGALAGLERAEVGAPQHRRAAARAELQRLPRRHRVAAATATGDEQR